MKSFDNELYSVDEQGNVFSGYDQREKELNATDAREDWEEHELASIEDRIALADQMIARWNAYKAMLEQSKEAGK